MLDHNLIRKNTQSIKNSLQNKTIITSNFGLINQVFDEQSTDKLKKYIDNLSSDQWEQEAGQEHLCRERIRFEIDTILEELHISLENNTAVLQDEYPHLNLRFDGLMIWRDTENYNIQKHTDNTRIAVNLQIYLFDQAPEDCGTRFYINDEIVDIPYKHNTGYILEQHTKKYPHETMRITPNGVTRHSLYAVWIHDE